MSSRGGSWPELHGAAFHRWPGGRHSIQTSGRPRPERISTAIVIDCRGACRARTPAPAPSLRPGVQGRDDHRRGPPGVRSKLVAFLGCGLIDFNPRWPPVCEFPPPADRAAFHAWGGEPSIEGQRTTGVSGALGGWETIGRGPYAVHPGRFGRRAPPSSNSAYRL